MCVGDTVHYRYLFIVGLVKRKVDSSSKSNATATTATSSVKKPKSQNNEVADLQPTEETAPASSSNLVSMLSSYASDDEKDS